MPNVWHHHVQVGDLTDAFDEAQTPFEEARDAVVTRLREHPFHAEHGGDIVLRSFMDDLAKAVTLEQFNRDLDYLRMWADQDHTRVWLCTMVGCPDCEDRAAGDGNGSGLGVAIDPLQTFLSHLWNTAYWTEQDEQGRWCLVEIGGLVAQVQLSGEPGELSVVATRPPKSRWEN